MRYRNNSRLSVTRPTFTCDFLVDMARDRRGAFAHLDQLAGSSPDVRASFLPKEIKTTETPAIVCPVFTEQGGSVGQNDFEEMVGQVADIAQN